LWSLIASLSGWARFYLKTCFWVCSGESKRVWITLCRYVAFSRIRTRGNDGRCAGPSHVFVLAGKTRDPPGMGLNTHELHRNSSTRYSVETWYYARVNLLYVTAAPACSYHRVSDFGDASFRQTASDCINQRISAGADAVLKEHIPR
jgi:hypothetical protein